MKVYTSHDLRTELKRRVKRSGLSQYAYAKKAGVYPTQLSNFISGQRETAGTQLLRHLHFAKAPNLFIRVRRKNVKKATGKGRVRRGVGRRG